MYHSVFMGSVVLQLASGRPTEQAFTLATSSGKRSTVQMATQMPKHTTILGSQAWFRSSGCWKAIRMYTEAPMVSSPTTTMMMMRNQFSMAPAAAEPLGGNAQARGYRPGRSRGLRVLASVVNHHELA